MDHVTCMTYVWPSGGISCEQCNIASCDGRPDGQHVGESILIESVFLFTPEMDTKVRVSFCGQENTLAQLFLRWITLKKKTLTTGFARLSPSRSTLSHLLEVLCTFFSASRCLRTEVDAPISLAERIVVVYYCTNYLLYNNYIYIYSIS